MKWAAAVLLVLLLGLMPFSGTDVAQLEPAELLYVTHRAGTVQVETDTGSMGMGKSLEAAIADLKKTASGQFFLETVDYLLLGQEAEQLMDGLYSYLRSGCAVCYGVGVEDLGAATAYLRIHQPDFTVRDYRAGSRTVPTLQLQEERLYLVF